MKIKLAVFDMAGTTVKDKDYVHLFLQQALRNHEVDVSREEINEVMGYPKPVAIKALLKLKSNGHTKKKAPSEHFIEKIHKDFLKGMIDFYNNSPEVKEKEGVSETFRALKHLNIKVVTDTGFDRSIANAILNQVGWVRNGLIDGSVTSDEVPNGRPYPDMIFKAMKIAGIQNVSEVAKIGDTVSDLLQGQAAGCGMVIGVTSGAFSENILKKAPHTHLIQQLPELLDILKGVKLVSNR